MNRAGMVVDVSHCSERTCLDAFAVSTEPVLITHSNCRALVANPRCKSDTVIRAMAARGGVMGITAVAAFVSGRAAGDARRRARPLRPRRPPGRRRARRARQRRRPRRRRSARPAGALARYAVRGLPPARRVFDLTEGLIRRGYNDRAIELILGGNFQRVLTEIWGGPAATRDIRDSASGPTGSCCPGVSVPVSSSLCAPWNPSRTSSCPPRPALDAG